jgi:hypothetical protein
VAAGVLPTAQDALDRDEVAGDASDGEASGAERPDAERAAGEALGHRRRRFPAPLRDMTGGD